MYMKKILFATVVITSVLSTTAQTPVTVDAKKPVIYYNFSGSEVKDPSNGVYVTSEGKKIVL